MKLKVRFCFLYWFKDAYCCFQLNSMLTLTRKPTPNSLGHSMYKSLN